MPTRPTTPSSSTPSSLTNPTAQLCIIPPSQRRHQARIARCAYIQARSGGSGTEGNAEAVQPTAERQGYAAEEVDLRRQERQQREEGEWRGWEDQAEGYAGEVFVGGLAGADALEGMEQGEASDGAPEAVGGLGLPGVGAEQGAGGGAGAEYRAWADSLDSPVAAGLGGARWQTTMPTLPGVEPLSALTASSGHTLPLVLGGLYLLARAWGVGSTGGRRRGEGEVQGKVRRERREEGEDL